MRYVLAFAASLAAAPAVAQENDLPGKRDYFCSLDGLVVVEDGRQDHFEDAYDEKKDPLEPRYR